MTDFDRNNITVAVMENLIDSNKALRTATNKIIYRREDPKEEKEIIKECIKDALIGLKLLDILHWQDIVDELENE